MENASKALIMAASVLLGLMIISIGVALFSSFSEYGRTTIEQAEEYKITEWNNNYSKYYGRVATYDATKNRYVDKPIEVTAHDIVSVANHAKQNNSDYELDQTYAGNENSYYVQVVVKEKAKQYLNFETFTEKEKNQFLLENALVEEKDELGRVIGTKRKVYQCDEVIYSPVTKRVMKITFSVYQE